MANFLCFASKDFSWLSQLVALRQSTLSHRIPRVNFRSPAPDLVPGAARLVLPSERFTYHGSEKRPDRCTPVKTSTGPATMSSAPPANSPALPCLHAHPAGHPVPAASHPPDFAGGGSDYSPAAVHQSCRTYRGAAYYDTGTSTLKSE